MNHRVVDAKAVMLAPYREAPVSVTSGGSGTVKLEPAYERSGYKSIQVARGLLGIALIKAFHVPLTNKLNRSILTPKSTVVAHLTDSSAHISTTKAALLSTDLETIGAAHYKPSVDRDTQMTRHNGVEARDDQTLKLDWNSEMQPSDDYAKYHEQLLDMLSVFQFVWDGRLGKANITKHCIELIGWEYTAITLSTLSDRINSQIGRKIRYRQNAFAKRQ